MSDSILDAQNATLSAAVAARTAAKAERGCVVIGQNSGTTAMPSDVAESFTADVMVDTFTADTDKLTADLEAARAEIARRAAANNAVAELCLKAQVRNEEVVAENKRLKSDLEVSEISLKRLGEEYRVWLDKTQWALEECDSRDDGRHLADVIKSKVDRLREEVAALQARQSGGIMEEALRQARAIVHERVKKQAAARHGADLAPGEFRALKSEWGGVEHVAPLQPMELRTQEQPPRFIKVKTRNHEDEWVQVALITRFKEWVGSEGFTELDVKGMTGGSFVIVETPDAFAARLNGQGPPCQ